jgi:hypothetical protein
MKYFKDTGLFNNSFLELTKDGKVVSHVNILSFMSTTVEATYHYIQDIGSVAPSSIVQLNHSKIEKDEQGFYNLNWGPLQYTRLKGSYTARVIWSIESSDAFDSKKKVWVKNLSIWTGKIMASPVRLELP